MSEFKSIEKFKISGRGDVYILPNPPEDHELTQEQCLAKWIGQEVVIDGQRFKCTGMEQYLVRNKRQGAHISMLTRPVAGQAREEVVVRTTEVAGIINWLKDAERHETADGLYFTGSFPMDYKDGHDQMWGSPWVISHPEAKDKLYRAVGIGYFGVNTKVGDPLSLKVVELTP